MALAGEVHARVGLVEADRDVWVALVVAQSNVERRSMGLDQIPFEDEGFGLRTCDHELKPLDARHHLGDLRMKADLRTGCLTGPGSRFRADRRLKVGTNALSQ